MHKAQDTVSSWNWPLVFGHFNKQTVKVGNFKNMPSEACYWEIQTDFMYKYLSLQDLKLKFDKLTNVKIYITSYFKINDSRPSNTWYFLNEQDT
jgi:hypothetical protein